MSTRGRAYDRPRPDH